MREVYKTDGQVGWHAKVLDSDIEGIVITKAPTFYKIQDSKSGKLVEVFKNNDKLVLKSNFAQSFDLSIPLGIIKDHVNVNPSVKVKIPDMLTLLLSKGIPLAEAHSAVFEYFNARALKKDDIDKLIELYRKLAREQNNWSAAEIVNEYDAVKNARGEDYAKAFVRNKYANVFEKAELQKEAYSCPKDGTDMQMKVRTVDGMYWRCPSCGLVALDEDLKRVGANKSDDDIKTRISRLATSVGGYDPDDIEYIANMVASEGGYDKGKVKRIAMAMLKADDYFKCPDCDYKAISQKLVDAHRTSMGKHSGKEENKGDFDCPYCSESHGSRDSQIVHTFAKHPEEHKEHRLMRDKADIIKKAKQECFLCGDRVDNVDQHLKEDHERGYPYSRKPKNKSDTKKIAPAIIPALAIAGREVITGIASGVAEGMKEDEEKKADVIKIEEVNCPNCGAKDWEHGYNNTKHRCKNCKWIFDSPPNSMITRAISDTIREVGTIAANQAIGASVLHPKRTKQFPKPKTEEEKKLESTTAPTAPKVKAEYSCRFCGKKFDNPNANIDHVRNEHGKESKEEIDNLKEKYKGSPFVDGESLWQRSTPDARARLLIQIGGSQAEAISYKDVDFVDLNNMWQRAIDEHASGMFQTDQRGASRFGVNMGKSEDINKVKMADPSAVRAAKKLYINGSPMIPADVPDDQVPEDQLAHMMHIYYSGGQPAEFPDKVTGYGNKSEKRPTDAGNFNAWKYRQQHKGALDSQQERQ